LVQAVSDLTGKGPSDLGALDGPSQPLHPGATLADLRQLVRPLGLDAVEVDLSENRDCSGWPVVGIRRADASAVALPAGASWPADAFEPVGYALFPRAGSSFRPPMHRWGLGGLALAVGVVGGQSVLWPSGWGTLGLGLAVLAGAGLIEGSASAADLRRWLGSSAPPVYDGEADGPYRWAAADVSEPSLRSWVWILGALGFTAGVLVGLPLVESAVALGWGAAAAWVTRRFPPARRSRAEVLVRVAAGQWLAALDDLRLLGRAEPARQAWLARRAEADDGARQRATARRSVALAAIVAGAALSASGAGLVAALAAIASGWGSVGFGRRKTPPPAVVSDGPPDGEIRLEGVRLGEDGLSVPALSVPDGALAVVVGAAGSGKTRLLRALLGDEPLTAGAGRVGGVALAVGAHRPGASPAEAERVVALGQEALLGDGDVATTVLGARLETEPAGAAWPALDAVGLAETVRALPMGLMSLVTAGGAGFSGGQRRRLAIARVLSHPARVRLLDEPLAGLDPDARAAVWAALRRAGGTTLVVTRDATLAADADVAYRLEGGVVRPLA